MTTAAGIVICLSLSVLSLLFFLALYYGDKRGSRRLEEKRMDLQHQQMLLQRIQAPQVAVDQHVIQQAEDQKRMTPHFDSDEEFHALDEMMIGIDPMGNG